MEVFWYQEGYAPAHTKEHVLPEGTVELVINLDDDARGTLIGAHATPFVLDTSRPTAILGAHFKPGGAFPFLGFPADEVTNAHVSLETLWGPQTASLQERLLAAEDLDVKFQLLEHALWRRVHQPLARHPAVTCALSAFETTERTPTVAAVTEQLGFSARHFSHLFCSEVGLTPKRYARVRRFQAALRLISRSACGGSDVALRCGYFDQSHFVNDFKVFCGLTPSAYLKNWAARTNHVPVFN